MALYLGNTMISMMSGISTGGIDTSDATATASDIASGKTAYVNGQKVTGDVGEETQVMLYDYGNNADAKPKRTYHMGESYFASELPIDYDMLVRGGSNSTVGVSLHTRVYGAAKPAEVLSGKTFTSSEGIALTGTCTYDANTSDATATASDIVKGKTAYVKGSKVTGTHTESAGLDTSDATAAASDIAKGKTAYVNGKKVTGTLDVKTELLNYAYPVGSIYMSVRNTSPQSFLGGTWVQWGAGRVPVGVTANDSNFNSVEKTGGASTVANALIQHTHTITASGTITSAGAHTHDMTLLFEKDAASGSAKNRVTPAPNGSQSSTAYTSKSAGAHTHSVTVTATAANAGSADSNSTHNNLQPYITCYMWKRTA